MCHCAHAKGEPWASSLASQGRADAGLIGSPLGRRTTGEDEATPSRNKSFRNLGAPSQKFGATGKPLSTGAARGRGTRALRDFNPAYVRFGVTSVGLVPFATGPLYSPRADI